MTETRRTSFSPTFGRRICIFLLFLSLFNLHWRFLKTYLQITILPRRLRVLYIVTSLSDVDSGRRETTKGYNRFNKTILPVLKESVVSMIKAGLDVDVYLITHWAVSETRRRLLANALPCALQIWDEATPVGYALEHSTNVTREISRGLARQHRFVIKDKLMHYDVFVNFEDDMLIHGETVQHYVNLTHQLYLLRHTAPDDLNNVTAKQARELFYGNMTRTQLRRMIPGFIRVEAPILGFRPHNENLFSAIPVDHDWNGRQRHVDPKACCHVLPTTANEHQIPLAPKDLYFWETSIDVLGVRKLPDHTAYWDWVLLQAGNIERYYPKAKFVIGDYWTGRDHPEYFGPNFTRPDRGQGRYINNQGGWMATRRQILEWHAQLCHGGFLPPYDPPGFKYNGLDRSTVEYWSGGIQIFGPKSCNLQRILTLEPSDFSKHLLYHTSNNKQRSGAIKPRYSSRTIDEFWGQLNTIRKNAEFRMQQELELEIVDNSTRV